MGCNNCRFAGRFRVAAAAAAGLALVACAQAASPADAQGGEDRLRVVATVAPVTSIVASVAGDRADVRGLIPEGADSHTYEPRPSAAAVVSAADVLYANGLELEGPVRDLADANMPAGAEVVELGSLAIEEDEYAYDFSFPRDAGRPNPHLWTNPRHGVEYARLVAADLSARDQGNASYYQANLAEFERAAERLDGAMRKSFATVPAADRKLLTYHDAYAYFARDYGWEVIGAIQVSDFGDPSPKEVAALIEQVRAEGVPAIFGSEVFPSPVLEQIGREAGVEYVDVLRDDDLPANPAEPGHSWAGLIWFNYVTITEALGGDASPLRGLQIDDSSDDAAEFPQ
ncbi:MAG TPA: metal ABC transporter substrate-binding protein, partial [Egibacteraceae bacterium]|nr:metal ABC transporter substrate-binding protein [Egibacteraceae bacterium]